MVSGCNALVKLVSIKSIYNFRLKKKWKKVQSSFVCCIAYCIINCKSSKHRINKFGFQFDNNSGVHTSIAQAQVISCV